MSFLVLFFVAGQNLACFKSDLLLGGRRAFEGPSSSSPPTTVPASSESCSPLGLTSGDHPPTLQHHQSCNMPANCWGGMPKLLPAALLDAQSLNLATALLISGFWLLWNLITGFTFFWTRGWNQRELISGDYADDLGGGLGYCPRGGGTGRSTTGGGGGLESRDVPDIADAFKNNSLDLLVTEEVYQGDEEEDEEEDKREGQRGMSVPLSDPVGAAAAGDGLGDDNGAIARLPSWGDKGDRGEAGASGISGRLVYLPTSRFSRSSTLDST